MTDDVRWLDEQEMAAWAPFVVSTLHLHAQLERDLKRAFDVTLLDHGILLMLRNTPGGLTMGHLAGQFGTEASVITYRVNRLEERGLARRARRETNRREVLARITPAGERLCDAMGPVHAASVRRHFLDHVPRGDLPAIADAFAHLYAAQREKDADRA
ncbi:MAG: MarR family winged helix-turn-helix transcriptional regulator [Candidatus Nanopelagicales bacterium]